MKLQGFLRLELLFQRECLLFGLRHFVRRCCVFFHIDLQTRIVFSTRVFVFLASGILQGGAVPFFQMKFK